ncbi:peptide chain release factor N(5)-glutamine methyltransferase [Candidatus Falkowbacteria bacterium]|nr:peptide chain release factor N(5)-glutamine methyltransferase [Candidatus Falkowbacteria bacterium]
MNTIKTTLQRFPSISRLEIETIIAHVLKKTREFILISPEHEITRSQIGRIGKLVQRREEGEPLAYLTGHKEFYGLDFSVDSNVLVPRPETELIIDELLAQAAKKSPAAIIDVGTGSGCIAITLAKLLNDRSIKFFAIDISEPALRIAKRNAHKHGVGRRVRFVAGDLLSPLPKFKIEAGSRVIITANLPYLSPSQIDASPSIRKEPRLALESGADGLKHYRQLFRQIRQSGFTDFNLLCEIDETQGASMAALIRKELPQAKFEIKQDLGHYDRLAVINSK